MASLILRFLSSDGFIGHAIDVVTNSLWSHVEIGTPEGTWIGAHADGGVQERAANYCTPVRERQYTIPMSDDQQRAILQFARAKVGTDYNFADIAGLLFHSRILNTPERFICSQFAMECFAAGGIWLLNVLPQYAYLVTPETLHLSPLLMGRCTLQKTAA